MVNIIKSSKAKKLRRILVLIPIILIWYIFFVNTKPFGGFFEYFIDIGGNADTLGDAKLIGPSERISERKKDISTATYREINSSLVYFETYSNLLTKNSNIEIEVKFNDTFSKSQKFLIGSKNKENQNYYWKLVYIPFYKEFGTFESVKLGDFLIYQVNKKVPKLEENSNTSDLILNNIPENTFVATDFSLDVKQWNEIEYEEGETIINTSFRGTHDFYVHIRNTLDLTIFKQDSNWYNGTDILEINVYDENGYIIANFSIPDDGIENKTGEKGTIQSIVITIPDLEEGIYRIELKALSEGADFYIKKITINQKQVVIANKLFIIDPVTVYFELPRQQTLEFTTYHQDSAQNLTISGPVARTVEIPERATTYNITLPAGNYTLTSPKGDVIIEDPTYFSFDKDSYFRPFKYEIVPLRYDIDWVKSSADYVIIPDLNVTDLGDGWKIGRASWDAKDLYIKDKTLSFAFNIPHLSKEEYKNYTIPIDWVKVTVTKPSIFEGIFGGLK